MSPLLSTIVSEFPREKYAVMSWRGRLLFVVCGRVVERMLPKDSIVLLWGDNTEILVRNNLPDLNSSGALALCLCGSHGISTMF